MSNAAIDWALPRDQIMRLPSIERNRLAMDAWKYGSGECVAWIGGGCICQACKAKRAAIVYYLYVAVCSDGFVKIGQTCNPKNRRYTYKNKEQKTIRYALLVKAGKSDVIDGMESKAIGRLPPDKRCGRSDWFSVQEHVAIEAVQSVLDGAS